MKTTFEDFEKTTLYENLAKTCANSTHRLDPTIQVRRQDKKDLELAIKTAFLVGHQLGLDEARAILTGEKE